MRRLFVGIAGGAMAPMAVSQVEWGFGQGGNGHAYEFVYAQGILWADAESAASAMSYKGQKGYLATITSQEENDFVLANVLTDPAVIEAWLGAQQLNPDDPPDEGWSWITGEPWVFTNWAPGEPNDDPGQSEDEHYLGMWGWSGYNPGMWNDQEEFIAGPFNITGFLVEYPVPAPGAGALLMAMVGGVGMRRRRGGRESLPH